MSGQSDLDLAIASDERAGDWTGVGEGGLYENPGHEGESPGGVSWLCLDLEGLSEQGGPRAAGGQPQYRSF
ncbi:MAG: hypothetical protein U9Q81_06035 [Pseudomonadota bacterium]|nr:hypothetical protein [Pseudomonadota bacterium]